jgi:hypothetical protein
VEGALRLIALIFVTMLTTSVLADGFQQQFTVPSPFDLGVKRAEMMEKLPSPPDETSRAAITTYRRQLDNFNTVVIQGYLAQISAQCEVLNETERKANQAWDQGEITPKQKKLIDQDIKSERSRCLDKFAKESPYYKLYYEMLDIYRKLDADSQMILVACNSNDACREG